MSDTLDTNDVVTVEDAAAAAEFNLTDLDIDFSSTPIADLLRIYREQCAIANEYAAKLKSGASDPTDVTAIIKAKVKNTLAGKDVTPEVKQTVGTLRSLGETLATEVFDNSDAPLGLTESAVMLEEMENLVSLMRDEYAYHLANAIQAEKDAKGIKSTPAESAIRAKLACIKLKGTGPNDTGLIGARLAMAKAMEGIALLPAEAAKHEIPANLYKTGGIRGGFNTDVFPRLPRLDLESSEVSGSSSTHLVFRFQATGLEEATDCSETTLNDVAHNVVSQGAYRITGRTVGQLLKKNGFGIGATDTEWSLEFKTGTLMGRKA